MPRQVYNPKSKRWVKVDGRIGRQLVKKKNAKVRNTSPSPSLRRRGKFVSKAQMQLCYQMKEAAETVNLVPSWDCDAWMVNTDVDSLPERVRDLNPILYRINGSTPIYIGPRGGTYFLQQIDDKLRKVYIRLQE